MRTLYIVRHGHYDITEGSPTHGRLTPLGVAQARLLGARLAHGVALDTLWQSPLPRAMDTASVLSMSLPAVPRLGMPALTECTPPGTRGTAAQDPPARQACERQIDEAARELFKPPLAGKVTHELVVGHSNVTRHLVMRALGAPPTRWQDLQLAHASLTVLEVRQDGSLRVLAVGDTGHLPASLTTVSNQPNVLLLPPGH